MFIAWWRILKETEKNTQENVIKQSRKIYHVSYLALSGDVDDVDGVT